MNMSESLTSELWLKVDQLHLKYLQSEDTPVKLEIRKKLEGLVAEYLSIVPQQRKFVSASTGDIISNSAKWKPDFSLVKASNAFRAIEQYAANLINQPWRQEFWSIRQYSGFYKHSVETALFGAEKMFLDMGYAGGGGQPAQVLSLAPPRVQGQHPVDIDMVTSVARDCVLASVECSLLADIHTAVSLQFPTMLEEVINFRRDHIGSVDVCVRELVYRKHQLRYQFPMTSPQYGLQNYGYPAPAQPVTVSVNSYPSQTNGYTPVSFQGSAPGPVYGGFPEFHGPAPAMAPQPPCYGPVNGNNGLYTGPGVQPQFVQQQQQHSGHHSHHSPAGSTSTLRQIPTTILELSGHEPVAPERKSRGDRDKVDGGGARPREHKEARNGNKSKSRKSGVEEEFDSWDYVYKHLEQTGYTKDQAERPDVLENNPSEEDLRRNIQGLRLREGRNDESHHNHHSHHRHSRNSREPNDRYSNSRQVETSESEQEQDHSRYSSAVSEDTLHHQPQRRDNGHHQPQRQPRGGDNGHHQQQKHQGGGGNGHADLWECSTCTFHNKQSRNICEMCSKSRDFAPQADIRSVEPAQVARKLSVPKIDGVACSKCTLVNSAKNKLCDACGATLPKNF